MKKIYLLSFVLPMTLFGGIDDRLDDLEAEMKQVSIYTPQDTHGASFAYARPEVFGENVFATFDLLYWHAKVGGSEYAYSFQPSIIQTGSILLPQLHGRTKHNDFDWEWGVKVGLGCHLAHDGWDLNAEYTWFESRSSNASTKASPSALMPLRLFSEMLALKAKSHFGLDYHNIDLSLGHSFFISKMVAFRPFVSVKTSWIDLDQDALYTASQLNDFLFPGPNQTVGLDFKSKNRSRFWGLGPQIGINSKWFLGNRFSLFNDLAGSILYGYFQTNYRESIPPDNVQFSYGKIIKNRSKYHRFVPYIRLYAGLGWERYLNCDKQHIALKFGYEVQYYWRANQMSQIEDTSNPAGSFSLRILSQQLSEDVMLYGFTSEFRLDF